MENCFWPMFRCRSHLSPNRPRSVGGTRGDCLAGDLLIEDGVVRGSPQARLRPSSVLICPGGSFCRSWSRLTAISTNAIRSTGSGRSAATL